LANIKNYIRSWRDLRRFRNLPAAERRMVFYSEGRTYGGFLAPVMDSLAKNHGQRPCYITSDAADPFLDSGNERFQCFYIGPGAALITAFQTMKATVLVMTAPDLDRFHIKRSVHPVHYVYLYHSMVSSHMIYREGAFDHYDTILCAGPHHVAEIRAWERLQGLPEKQLLEHGYGPLDALMAQAARRTPRTPLPQDKLRILLAPSWGIGGLLETGAGTLVKQLLGAGHQVWVRPHPRTRQLSPKVLDALRAQFIGIEGFHYDEDTSDFDALFNADVMISDWSGVALEFAFGLGKPVLFIDGPRKINNPRYQEIGVEPLEVTCRDTIGAILDPSELGRAPEMVESLWRDREAIDERARRLRTETVFNVANSGDSGAAIIARLAAET
jgi:hypothetical protein